MTNECRSPSVVPVVHRRLPSTIISTLLPFLCYTCCFPSTQALTVAPSRSVTLPWKRRRALQRDDDDTMIASLHRAFDTIVDTSDYLESFARATQTDTGSLYRRQSSPAERCSSCRIPALGDNIVIDFYYLDHTSVKRATENRVDEAEATKERNCDCFVLEVSGASLTDFGWICAKFYGERTELVELLNMDALRKQVASHYSRQPPSPGYTPAIMDIEEERLQQTSLRAWIRDVDLRQLEEQGYVVLDPDNIDMAGPQPSGWTARANYEVSDQSQADLSQYLTETTGDVYRKDMVNFLTKSEAASAGIGRQFAMLMSIATFLNNPKHIDLRTSDDTPIAPATVEAPLTVPRVIQLAQYSQGDYYDAHSDNSYEQVDGDGGSTTASDNPASRIRSNFRHYTCILYCNDLQASDGGALRLYLNSRELRNNNRSMEEVVAASTCSFIDVVPQNGRLLIFDSCLVHSVQKVTSPTKLRRALTLWILRPDDSGVKGETFY